MNSSHGSGITELRRAWKRVGKRIDRFLRHSSDGNGARVESAVDAFETRARDLYQERRIEARDLFVFTGMIRDYKERITAARAEKTET